jgi:hypothetical protein
MCCHSFNCPAAWETASSEYGGTVEVVICAKVRFHVRSRKMPPEIMASVMLVQGTTISARRCKL